MKKARKQSFIRRISWNMLILVLASNVTICAAGYTFFYQRILAEAVSFGKNMLMANQQVVDHYFRQVDQIADGIIYNESINNVMRSSTDTSELMQELKTVERIYFHSRKDLKLFFYKEQFPENVYSIHTSGDYERITDFRTSYWYDRLTESGANHILLTNIYSEGEQNDGQFVHSMIYKIKDLYADHTIGYLRIDMDLEQLQEQLILDYAEIEGVQILSDSGEVLFYSHHQLELPEGAWEIFGHTGKIQQHSDRDAIYCVSISEETGWLVMLRISKEDLYQDEVTLFLFFLAFLFLSLGICLFAVSWNTDILTKNMNHLTNGINAVKNGNLKARVRAEEVDEEIDRVIVDFNEMVKQTHVLMRKVENKQALLDEVQIKALQQQINPHFIYNSLETLMGMATEGMDKEIIEICKCMSAMLRYNTKMEKYSTLGQEIRQIRNYAKVMEMRMRENFVMQYAVDEELLDARIVKFALQPLLENAISHGMANKPRGGTILVEVKRAEISERIEIRIVDNGMGIHPGKLQEIRKQLAMEDEVYLRQMENAKATGLLNVHLRLKLYFGRDYQLELGSRIGQGTDLRIRIPYWREEESCTGL